MSSSSSATDNAPSVVERVQEFISENKKVILLCTAAAVIAGGAAAYYSATSRPKSTQDTARDDIEKGEKTKDKKKSSKSGKKKRTVKDSDGPILEERKPKLEESTDTDFSALSEEQIAAMSTEERTKAAAQLKAKGNSAYSSRKFAEAIEHYTHAIKITPKPEAVFFSNRAACHMNSTPPNYERVVEDCDAALQLDTNYVKALNRRAIALEALERYQEALRDFTAATILDRFQNDSAAQAVDRVLKKYASKEAAAILGNREPRLPSHTFISAYFAAFRPRAHPALPESPTQGDETLLLALQALEAADYSHALTLVNESIEQGISWDIGRAEALNLRATFKFLLGDIISAKDDLLKSIELVPSFTQSLVKIASVYMEQGDTKQAFDCFEEAIKQNPNDPDIYYHRGQVLFIMNEYNKAAENYSKSMEIDDQFVFSHIQLAVAQYKAGHLATSMSTFRETLRAFPQRSEPQNYYGELLLDQQRFPDAVEKFDRAIELEKLKTPPNVLPLVNKGLTIFQWKQDISAAERCCNEALRIDPECEAAVATLAQLSLQQNKIDQAIGFFEKQSDLARSELELVAALTYQYASKAQLEFTQNYPAMAAQLNQMARAMAS